MSIINTPLRKKITELLQKVNINKYIDFLGVTDTHIENKALHFKEEDIDHVKIQKIGNNTHAQIDTHIASTNKHIDWTNATQNFSTSGTGNFAGDASFRGEIISAFGDAVNTSGRLSFVSGANNGRNTFSSASSPSIYVSEPTSGSYPFNTRGNLIIEGRTDVGTRDVVFVTGTGGSPGVAMKITSAQDVDVINDLTAGTIQADDGFTGSFTAGSGETVTVVGGIITGVV